MLSVGIFSGVGLGPNFGSGPGFSSGSGSGSSFGCGAEELVEDGLGLPAEPLGEEMEGEREGNGGPEKRRSRPNEFQPSTL